MKQGKYYTPRRKHSAAKHPVAVLVSLALILLIGIGATIAYLQDETVSIENNFTPAEVPPTINNKASNEVKVKIYMRALGAQEDTDEFLSQMTLTVTQKTDTILFDAPADQTAQLTDWVCLGTFYSGAEINLEVTLHVPVTMGNEFQDAVGYLDWEFKVEELPVDPNDPRPPQTGDGNILPIMMAVSLVSMAIVIVLAFVKKEKKEG